jgi:ABC-type glycerol-3-phosphate transport system substrate-binding protein
MLKKKKIIACFVLVLMVVGGVMPLIAQDVPTVQNVRLPNPPRSLRGMDIIIGNYWADYDTNTFQPRTDTEERQLEWRRRIQADHGFTMRERNIASWNEMPQVAATSIMAGRPAASVFMLQADWAMSLYKQNLLFPVSTARSVRLDRNQFVEWNSLVASTFTFNRNQYAFQIGYGGSLQSAVIFFNKRLFREAGLDPDHLYNLQANNQWTWDAFLEVCRVLTRYINNDGVIDTYAMSADLSTYILDTIVASNGALYVDRDRNGRFVNATGRPEFLEALQFAIRLQREGVMMPRPEGTNWDWYKGAFIDGRVAMRLEPEYVRNELGNMRDDWGMVVPPRGPRARNYVVFTSENVMVIPRTFNRDQVDAIMWAVQAWNIAVDANWRLGQYQSFRDIRAVNETMAIIRDPARQQWKFHIFIPGLQRGNIAWEMWHFDGEPAQLVESVSQNWNLRIEDANE